MLNFSYPTVHGYSEPDIDKILIHWNDVIKDPKYAHYVGKLAGLNKILASPNEQFPYGMFLEIDHYEMSILEDVLWQSIGPEHDECSKEESYSDGRYADNWVCPGVEIDEYYYASWWDKDHDNFWHSRYATYDEFLAAESEGPRTHDHSHYGDWKVQYVAKVGYDRGLERIGFKRKIDLDDFKTKISCGPQYEFIGEENAN